MAEQRNKFGLTERDMRTIKSIFDAYPEVKGNHRFGSDVDLAIMNEGVETKKLAKLKSNFEGSSLPYNIDLVDFTKLDNRNL